MFVTLSLVLNKPETKHRINGDRVATHSLTAYALDLADYKNLSVFLEN